MPRPDLNQHVYEVLGIKDGEQETFRVTTTDIGDHRYQVVVEGPTGHHVGEADDLFEALLSIRRQIDPTGWRLAVGGARRDTWPSGLLRDQMEGAVVYVLPADPQQKPDSVGTFAPAPIELLATVEEQEANWERWKKLPRT